MIFEQRDLFQGRSVTLCNREEVGGHEGRLKIVRPKERLVMSGKIRSAALVLVLSALFTSSAYALPPVHAAAGLRTGGFLAAAWSWLASLVLPAAPDRTPVLRAVWEKEGSSM